MPETPHEVVHEWEAALAQDMAAYEKALREELAKEETDMSLTAAQLRSAAADADSEPSEAQKESGNYRKGHVRWKGLPIAIENAIGSYRRGVSKDGTEWQTKMKDSYGYIKRTESEADGDHIDIFLCDDDLDSDIVFIVNQLKADGAFDEHKVIGGVSCADRAEEVYKRNYSKDWKGFGGLVPMTMPDFLEWIDDGETGKSLDMSAWVKYEGPRHGKGWRSQKTGRVVYQESMPGEHEHGGESHYEPEANPVQMLSDELTARRALNAWMKSEARQTRRLMMGDQGVRTKDLEVRKPVYEALKVRLAPLVRGAVAKPPHADYAMARAALQAAKPGDYVANGDGRVGIIVLTSVYDPGNAFKRARKIGTENSVRWLDTGDTYGLHVLRDKDVLTTRLIGLNEAGVKKPADKPVITMARTSEETALDRLQGMALTGTQAFYDKLQLELARRLAAKKV